MFSAQQIERPGRNEFSLKMGFHLKMFFWVYPGMETKMDRISRKEIFRHEIETGATIEEIKIYTNSLRLILAVFHREKDFPESELLEEILDLQKKIKLYEKKVKKI